MVLLFVVYNLSRGFADNGATPHAMELIVADRFMFGWATGGEVPTVWLQQHLYHPAGALVGCRRELGVLLPLRGGAGRRRGALAARPAPLGRVHAALGFPLRGRPGHLLHLPGRPALVGGAERPAHRGRPDLHPGWKAFGMHGAGNVLNAGQIASNPVAAMPSLHTAWALFVVLFFLTATRRRWWPLLLAYPLAMTFTLVYSGEHYVIDVLVGWAYVGLTFLVVGLAERGWAAWRARHPNAGGTGHGTHDSPPTPPPGQPEPPTPRARTPPTHPAVPADH